MENPEPTIYERLRRRSVLLAWSWALLESCRLTFAVVTFLYPWVLLVFILFGEAQKPTGHVLRALGEWQLYASILVVSGLSLCFWKLAERGSQRLLSVLREEDD